MQKGVRIFAVGSVFLLSVGDEVLHHNLWSRCPCNIRDFDLGQVPGRVHSYAALELQRVSVASCWGREKYFLFAGGGHTSGLPMLPNKGAGGD